jgi:CDP-diacylglycerol--glycerol-3-phosphate 3-phosphatidyltransferase
VASDQVVTVPNLLSLARLVLAIVFFVALEQGRPVAAFWLFAIAASTDWVDGWYARRFNQVSRLGRIFDPLVDKVIVCGAYVLLAAAIRAEMEKAGNDFSAALSGKLKMVLQCLAIGLVLAGLAWPDLEAGGVGIGRLAGWVSWAAVIATIWSGLEYLYAARVLVRR